MKKMPDCFNLDVENPHIEKGVYGDAGSCPIALSLQEFLGDDCIITVTSDGPITVKPNDNPNVKYVFADENWVGSWAHLFDEGYEVRPINIDFQLNDGDVDEDEDGVTVYNGEVKIYDICETVDLWEIMQNGLDAWGLDEFGEEKEV